MILNKKTELKKILILVVIFQVLLLINLPIAISYSIHQTDDLVEEQIKEEKKINGLTLKEIFSLDLFGSVSAQGIYCCEERKEEYGGGSCIDVEDENECIAPPEKNVQPTNCTYTSYCKPGWCIDDITGFCSPSPLATCVGGDVTWTETYDEEKCQEGCCTYENTKLYTTQPVCTRLSGSFDSSVSEAQCRFYTQDEGACVLSGENCVFTTEDDCETNRGGSFHKGLLCTNPGLETVCEPTSETTCVDGKYDVYFKDSCENPSNIYDSEKVDNQTYWNYTFSADCTSGSGCGLCGYPADGQCIEETPGNARCKSLHCTDPITNTPRKNLESWCVYEGVVGNVSKGFSADLPGTEHWKFRCDQGEVKKIYCGEGYRNQICAETIHTLNDDSKFSEAQCRYNEWWKCYSIALEDEWTDDGEFDPDEDGREECNSIPDCRVHEVDVDKYFKFGACVPKYSPGFDIDSRDAGKNGEEICALASVNCPVIYVKKAHGDDGFWDYEPEENKKCLDDYEYLEKMNNFCISLGDCGGYLSPEGKYVKNFGTGGKAKRGDLEEDYISDAYETYLLDEDAVLGEDIDEGELPRFLSTEGGGLRINEILEAYATGSFDPGILPSQWFFGILGWGGVTFYSALIILPAFALTPIGWVVLAIAALLAFLSSWTGLGDTKTYDAEFTCLPWQPPLGGDDCESCHENSIIPCTEYKCKSLGKGCDFVDQDTTNPLCIYAYSDDITPPVISFVDVIGDYTGTPKITNSRETGVEIKGTSQDCIQEFTDIEFILKTNEYADCKYTFASTPPSYDDMEDNYPEEGTDMSINHTIKEIIPAYASPDVSNGNWKIYVRCRDYNGRFNLDEYLVDLCVSERPETQVPSIKEFIPASGSYLPYGINYTYLTIKLDEPANCSWSRNEGTAYQNMQNVFESCETYDPDFPQQTRWTCDTGNSPITDLTEPENKIYIRCNDTLNNYNLQDTVYTIYSTENPLEITSTSPSGEIIGGGDIFLVDLTVDTSGGVDNGISTCDFKYENHPQFSIEYFPQIDSSHTYTLTSLSSGDYNISVHCEDSVGNNAYESIIFNLFRDISPPQITRAYKDGGSLQIVTDEEAVCYYDVCGPLFGEEDKIQITTGTSRYHRVTWDSHTTYYIRCEDLWEIPNVGSCMILQPSDLV